MTLAEFISKNGIFLHAEKSPGRPDMKEWPEATHWWVTLARYRMVDENRAFPPLAHVSFFYSMGSGFKGRRPTVAEVVESMASSASMLGYTFEEHCAEFGADEDSRKAYRLYEEAQAELREFREFLGREAFQELGDIEF